MAGREYREGTKGLRFQYRLARAGSRTDNSNGFELVYGDWKFAPDFKRQRPECHRLMAVRIPCSQGLPTPGRSRRRAARSQNPRCPFFGLVRVFRARHVSLEKMRHAYVPGILKNCPALLSWTNSFGRNSH